MDACRNKNRAHMLYYVLLAVSDIMFARQDPSVYTIYNCKASARAEPGPEKEPEHSV